MAGLGWRGHMQARTVLLALAAILAPSERSLALAEQEQYHHYTVTLTETERLDGSLEAATLSCPVTGACVGLVRVEVFGRPYDYLLSAVASDDRISFIFRGRTPITPALNHRQGYPFNVPLAPDGTGHRNVALAAAIRPDWRSQPGVRGFPRQTSTPVPVANVRITVRREESTERNR